MGVKVLNLEKEFDKLIYLQDKQVMKEAAQEAGNILFELIKATPVDTGLARESWKISMQKSGISITNSVPYIDRLNRGSSKQAPAFFVERVALRHGVPNGTIVNYSK
jgi:hypothetical protein